MSSGEWTARHGLFLVGSTAISLAIAVNKLGPVLTREDFAVDDMRQHIFWMARFRDPGLFPNDPIADYFQAVAPSGYSALYWLASWLFEPLTVARMLSLPLTLIAAILIFLFVRRLYPEPEAAFLATVLACWYAWQHDDLASSTPRAFALPMLAAQLWALVGRRRALAAAAVCLAVLLYPQAGILGLVLLAVTQVRFRGRRPSLSARPELALLLGTSAFVFGVLLFERAGTEPFGPLVAAAEARRMPEFGEHARSSLPSPTAPLDWLSSSRSGLNLLVWDGVFGVRLFLWYLAAGALLVMLLPLRRLLSGVRLISPRAVVLLHLLAASIGTFLLAHATWFSMHWPNRYVQWSLPLVLSVAGGIALAILIRALSARFGHSRAKIVSGILCLGVVAGLVLWPIAGVRNIIRDRNPRLTRFLERQPKDVIVAGVTVDTDPVPLFARRSVLTSKEYLLPFHLGYYNEQRRRMNDLIQAYYSPAIGEVVSFAERYGVDFFLVNDRAFKVGATLELWGEDFRPFRTLIIGKVQESARYALRQAAPRCAAARQGDVTVVPTSCLAARSSASGGSTESSAHAPAAPP